MKSSFGQRFLVVYAGVLTAVFAVTVLSGFSKPDAAHFDELTVHRINVVEPDGTLRMVISDKANFPGLIVKGKEYPHDRSSAGMLFFNDEGTENGGLIFHGYRDKDGKVDWWGHLSFDQYMQDQVLTLDAGESNGERVAGLKLVDRPDYPISEWFDLMARIRDLPEAQQKAAKDRFRASHPEPQQRLMMARLPDGSVALGLNDPEGRARIMLKVGEDGTPSIQMLDANGKVVGRMQPVAATSAD